jgi:hypothetical protein
MNNFVALIMAILEHVGVVTETEARNLIKDLQYVTIPDNYEGASKVVKDLFEKHGVKDVATKVAAPVFTIPVTDATAVTSPSAPPPTVPEPAGDDLTPEEVEATSTTTTTPKTVQPDSAVDSTK